METERGSWLRILTSAGERPALTLGNQFRAQASSATPAPATPGKDGQGLPGPGLRLQALEASQEGRVPEGRGLQPWLLCSLCRVACHPDRAQPGEVTAKDEAKEPGKEWDLAAIRGQSGRDYIMD